jgi:hypothetical protein
MKIVLRLIWLSVFIVSPVLCDTPVRGGNAPGLQVISIKGNFLNAAGRSVEEYDYLQPNSKYRLLPESSIELSTLDGKETYFAEGPGVVLLDSSGSVRLNGKALTPEVQKSFFEDVTATKVPEHEIGGVQLRGNSVLVRTPQGKAIHLYRDSYALVVGNGNYTNGWDPLPGAIKDVEDVAKTLEQNGFKVTLMVDVKKEDFDKAFWKLCYESGKAEGNRILFYYAGHGYTQQMTTGEDLGYLVMVDAPLPEKDPMGFNLATTDMQAMVTQAKMIKSRHALFIFDSCFSGSILNLSERVVPESVSERVRLPVRQFITAGHANEPVPDRSIFKQAFLDLLEGRDKEPIPDGYVTGSELGFYLKNKVPEYNSAQHPQYGRIRDIRLDKGDFVFVVKNPSAPSAPQDSLLQERERLERERRDLEKLKAEVERKQRESPSEEVETATLPEKPVQPVGPSSTLEEAGRDGLYVAHANGIVSDTGTGLEWVVGPDKDMSWNDAKSWVEGLNLAGGGWRMPTVDELEGLYKKGAGDRNMTSLLKNSGWDIWSGETTRFAAWFFGFRDGNSGWYSLTGDQQTGYARVFAVRSHEEAQPDRLTF